MRCFTVGLVKQSQTIAVKIPSPQFTTLGKCSAFYTAQQALYLLQRPTDKGFQQARNYNA
jgi:hypothetical protein